MESDEDQKPCTSTLGDPVVAEMDLLIAKDPAERKILLLQYPLWKDKKNAAETAPISASYMQRSGKLEVKLPLNTNSEVYDRTKGKELAKTSGGIYDDIVNVQTLSSTNIKGHAFNSYALGFVKNGALHLSPISGVSQMRHNFKYISKRPASSAAALDQGDSSQSESETEAAVQTVRVKFTKDQSKAGKARGRVAFGQEDDETDPWVPLFCRKAETLKDRVSILSKISDEVTVPKLTRKLDEAVRLFVPEGVVENSMISAFPCDTLLLSDIRDLPLDEQVKALMENGRVMKFHQLWSLVNLQGKEDEVAEKLMLEAVMNMATLIHGCWVINSDSLKYSTEVDREQTIRARDYILYRMLKGELVTRLDVHASFQLPDDQILALLKELGNFQGRKGWAFKYPPDQEFISKHGDLVRKYEDKWELRWNALKPGIVQHMDRQRRRARSGNQKPEPRRRRRTNSARSSLSCSDSEPKKEEGNLRVKVEAAEPGKRSRVMSNGSDHQSSNLASLSQKAQSELCKLVYQRFCERPVISVNGLRQFLKLKLSEIDADNTLNGLQLTDQQLAAAARQIGAKQVNPHQESQNGIFAFGERGSLPEIRKFFIEFIQDRNSFRFLQFKKECSQKLSISVPSDPVLKSLLQEYCVLKNGIYTLCNGD